MKLISMSNHNSHEFEMILILPIPGAILRLSLTVSLPVCEQLDDTSAGETSREAGVTDGTEIELHCREGTNSYSIGPGIGNI